MCGPVAPTTGWGWAGGNPRRGFPQNLPPKVGSPKLPLPPPPASGGGCLGLDSPRPGASKISGGMPWPRPAYRVNPAGPPPGLISLLYLSRASAPLSAASQPVSPVVHSPAPLCGSIQSFVGRLRHSFAAVFALAGANKSCEQSSRAQLKRLLQTPTFGIQGVCLFAPPAPPPSSCPPTALLY